MSDLMIYKHNELIENFIFNATESELQILNYAVAITNPKWENKNLVYTIDIPELVATYKTKSNNAYKHYRESLRKLMRREYEYFDTTGNKITENMVIRTKENINDTTWLEFKFNDYISTRLSNLKGLFTSYDIKHIAMFKSKYAFMLYEFFKLNLDQANHSGSPIYSKKISLPDFRLNLGIIGKYKIFRDLETKVLKVAKENINEHSNIRMSYTVTRKGRTPTHIILKAQYKKNHEPNSKAIDTKQQEEMDLDESKSQDKRTEDQITTGKRALSSIKKLIGVK